MSEVVLVVQRLWHHIPLAILLNLSLGAVGVPALTESLLVAAGAIAVRQGGTSLCVLASAVAGSSVGMSWTFFAGRAVHGRGTRWLSGARLHRAYAYCRRFGPVGVTLGYFVPGLRHAAAFAAGASAMRSRPFMAAAVVGAGAWAAVLLWTGHWMGR